MNEDLFGSIKQTITETAGAVGKKSEEFVETQKMRNKVRTLQREIRKKYADVGEIVYKRYVDGDTMDEELTGHCEVVMGLQKELAECKESMAAKQGKNVCPACGISNPKDAVFCMYCGTELPGEEEEKEEEWFTQGPVEETEDQEEKEEKEGEEPETEVEEETEDPQEETAPEQDACDCGKGYSVREHRRISAVYGSRTQRTVCICKGRRGTDRYDAGAGTLL